jgi:septal ring factor EnvC (AmiA/AmiB activator)
MEHRLKIAMEEEAALRTRILDLELQLKQKTDTLLLSERGYQEIEESITQRYESEVAELNAEILRLKETLQEANNEIDNMKIERLAVIQSHQSEVEAFHKKIQEFLEGIVLRIPYALCRHPYDLIL